MPLKRLKQLSTTDTLASAQRLFQQRRALLLARKTCNGKPSSRGLASLACDYFSDTASSLEGQHVLQDSDQTTLARLKEAQRFVIIW
jgi:hypothetical protein